MPAFSVHSHPPPQNPATKRRPAAPPHLPAMTRCLMPSLTPASHRRFPAIRPRISHRRDPHGDVWVSVRGEVLIGCCPAASPGPHRRGRIAAGADVDTLAPMLIGTGHLLFAARDSAPPDPAAVAKVVAAAIASVVP